MKNSEELRIEREVLIQKLTEIAEDPNVLLEALQFQEEIGSLSPQDLLQPTTI